MNGFRQRPPAFRAQRVGADKAKTFARFVQVGQSDGGGGAMNSVRPAQRNAGEEGDDGGVAAVERRYRTPVTSLDRLRRIARVPPGFLPSIVCSG